MGTINNFFRPLRSGVEGVFGGASLILMAALVPVVSICRVKIPFVIWTIWGTMIAVFLHMQGARTPVHYFTWKYLPLADSFRVAGRISMIFPVLILLILAWIIQKSATLSYRDRIVLKTPLMILSSAALLSMIVYSLVPDTIVSQTSTYTASTIRNIPFWVEPSAVLLGTLALVMLVMQNFTVSFKKALGPLLCLVTCLQMILLLQYGTWIEHPQDTPTLSRMRADKKERLDYRLTTASGMENSIIYHHLQYSFLEPFLGKIYHRYRIANDNQMVYEMMQDDRRPNEAIIEKYSSGQDQFSRPRSSRKEFSSVKLTYSSFNRLVFDIQNSRRGLFSLAYPYTKNWKAYVNGTETALHRINGAYLAIEVPVGPSQVEFQYHSSAAIWGMIISCITLALICCVICIQKLKYPLSLACIVGVLTIVTGSFLFWYRSLYNGANLETHYVWKEKTYQNYSNIAYGKRTNMSPAAYQSYFEIKSSSSRAVDGVKTPASGFRTEFIQQPWWVIDLHRPNSFKEIVIYEGPKGPDINQRPLTVAISNEGRNWQVAETVSEINQQNPLRITFNEPLETRYLMIRAAGEGYLSIDEVEIQMPHDDN